MYEGLPPASAMAAGRARLVAFIAGAAGASTAAANCAFQAAIADAGGNPYYIAFFLRVLDEGRRLLRLYYESYNDRLPQSIVGEHEDIIAAIEAGADDVESDAEDGHVVYTAFEDLNAVAEALAARFGDPKSTSIIWRPKTTTPVAGDQAATLMKLLDALDDEDDVQNVFSNFDLPASVQEELANDE